MKIAASPGFGGCLIVMLACAAIGAVAWPYVINTWLVFFYREPIVVWWQGALLGLIPGLGQITFAAVVVTWVTMLFLG